MAESETEPTRLQRWAKRAPLLACLFVLVIGGIYSAQLDRTKRFKDESDYVRCGHYLFHEGVFSTNGEDPTAYRPPGYPVVVGLVFQSGGSGVAIRMTNYVALCATILLASRFLLRRGLPRAAILASVLTGIYPPFIYTASTLYPQTVGALLLVGMMNLLPLGRELSVGKGALIGLVAGGLALTIPTFVAGIALMLCWLLYRGRGTALAGVLVAGLVMTTCVGAWSYRNYLAFDAFVPISTNAGRNLLLGNSEHATATSGVSVDISEFETLAHPLDEPGRDHLYRDAALDWIRSNPARALGLYGLKVLNHFNVWNNFATEDQLGRIEAIGLALFFIPLFAVFLWRLYRRHRRPLWETESLLILLYFGMAFATAIFFTRIRFRLPLDHLMIWVSAAFLARDGIARDRRTVSE